MRSVSIAWLFLRYILICALVLGAGGLPAFYSPVAYAQVAPDMASPDAAAAGTTGGGQGQGEAKGEASAGDTTGETQVQAAVAAATSAPETGTAGSGFRPSAGFEHRTANGDFRFDFPIRVPAFRGLEPKLTAAYRSNCKSRLGGTYQGWLGFGWGLSGLDVIERASPGKGAPKFDAADIFLFNGERLEPCTAGMVSPGCDAGGTHATRVESYLRIVRNTALNEWTVTGRGRTIAYDGANRPLTIDAVSFTYGPDGARPKKTAGGVTTPRRGTRCLRQRPRARMPWIDPPDQSIR